MRSALDHIRTAEMNEEVQTKLEDLETLYSELLIEKDRQRRDQGSGVENVKPAVLQDGLMANFALAGFLDHIYSTA